MKLYLPDTDIFVYAYHGEEPYASHLAAWVERKSLGISAMVAAEFLSGADREAERRFNILLSNIGILPVNAEVVNLAAAYKRFFLKKKKKIKLSNCLIAATAKIHQATLVTGSADAFPMDDIEKLIL